MRIENNIKKAIVLKWNIEFPDLIQFGQNKLYIIIGPIIGGIEIFNQPRSEDYRPYIAWYPLWKLNLKECISEEIILQEIRNKKGMLYDIPYRKNDTYFEDVIIHTKQQLFFPFYRDIKLQELFRLIDNQFLHTLVKSSPVNQATLFEAKFFSALYVGDMDVVEKVWAEINKTSKSWLPDLFEWKYGNINVWLQGLKEKISNREEFLKHIEINKRDKKIAQLSSLELIV